MHFVLGGARSGKSRYAETLVEAAPAPWHYVATAQAFDDEMRARIAVHRARRPAPWRTVEVPIDLPGALAALPSSETVLVDCLTLWLSNLILADAPVEMAGGELVAALKVRTGLTVLVSNEVGFGIVPETPLGRRFRDAAGLFNQQIARASDHTTLVVAGLPVKVK